MIFNSDNDRRIRHGSNLEATPAWKALAEHHAEVRDLVMRDLFERDPGRFHRFSVELGPLLFDYSKNLVTYETMSLLVRLAHEAGVAEAEALGLLGEIARARGDLAAARDWLMRDLEICERTGHESERLATLRRLAEVLPLSIEQKQMCLEISDPVKRLEVLASVVESLKK